MKILGRFLFADTKELIAGLEDTRDNVRLDALMGLAKKGDEAKPAKPILFRILEDEYEEEPMRLAVAMLLIEIEPTKEVFKRIWSVVGKGVSDHFSEGVALKLKFHGYTDLFLNAINEKNERRERKAAKKQSQPKLANNKKRSISPVGVEEADRSKSTAQKAKNQKTDIDEKEKGTTLRIIFNCAEFPYDEHNEEVEDALFDALNRTGLGDVLGAANDNKTWDIGIWVLNMEKGLEVIRTTLCGLGCPSGTEIHQDEPKHIVHRLREREEIPQKEVKAAVSQQQKVFDGYGNPIPLKFMKPVTVSELEKLRKVVSSDDIPRGYYDRQSAALLCERLAQSKSLPQSDEDRKFYKRVTQENPLLEIVVTEEEEKVVPKVFVWLYFRGVNFCGFNAGAVPDIHGVLYYVG
jgi:hypothetical protein